ncbi:MAG: PKD domain-containing protein, partial [Candidatus Thermoplasmatota archaeon]|nr:PKD domain-containing protein [Candidatus Thermoplasmatota archaeon]
LSSNGNSLGYSTYLGSGGYEYPYGGMALDKYNNMHVTGYNYYSGYPTTSGAYDTSYQYYDVVVSKLGSAFADDVPPTITADRSDAVAYGGQPFRFKADMSDNVWLVDAYVEYWAGTGTHTNVSLSLVSLEASPNAPNSIGTLYYRFSAKDYHGNWGNSSTFTRTLLDGIGPTFSNIGANPYPPVTGSPLNLTVDVYDNVAYNASTVTLYYKDPRAPSYTSVLMNHFSGDTFYYVGNVSIYWDTIYFYFEAYDFSMNLGRSPTYYTYVYDNVPPTLVNDLSPTAGTTGDRFDIMITMNDNIGIGYAYVVYWFGTGSPSSRSLSIGGGGYGANQLGTTTINIPSNSMDNLYYYYDFMDYDGNYWSSGPSSTFNISVSDNDAPVLTSVISPTSTTTGESTYFSFRFVDNIDGTAIAGAAVNYSYNNDWGNSWTLPLSYNSTSYLWESASLTVSSNSLGPLTFQVNSTDHQGNIMEHRGLSCPIYDNDDPIFNADNTPSSGTTGDPHNFTINAIDNIEISTVYLHMEYLNGIPYPPLPLTDAGAGNFYRLVTLEHKLAPITYNFTIIDSSGNWIQTGDFSVTLSDNDKPDIVDMTRKVVRAGEEDFPIKAIIIDNIELESIEMEYWFSFDPTVREVTLSVLSPDVYYYLVDIPSTPGTMSYKFKATDTPGGNINEVVYVVDILDAVLPEITGVTAEGTAYTGDEYSISATISDNIGITDAKLYYSFGMDTPLFLDLTVSEDTYSCTISVPHALDPLFFWIEAMDEPGNRATTEIYMVPVADNDLPVLEIDLSDTEASTGESFMLKLNATDNIGIEEVVVSLRYPGGDWENHTMMVMDITYYLEVTMPNNVVGDFSYYFTVHDTSMNMVSSEQVDVEVVDDEQPFAAIVGPDETYQHREVVFTSEGSMDNVGITDYKWEINGEPFEGSQVAYTFHEVGEYTVELKVSDGVNPTVNTTHSINVRDADDPVIVLDMPGEIGNHLRLVADASGSTDNVGIVSYSWLVVLPDSSRITGIEDTFEYDLVGIIGNITIYLTIMDAEGNYASAVYEIGVLDLLAPVVRAPADAEGREETVMKFSDQGSTDNTGIKSYMWTITFDDEDVVRYGKTMSYYFEEVGTYNITLTVFDAYDNFASDHFLVEIIEQDPDLDSDGDGMPDWWEDEYSLDKNVDDAQRDYDRDLLTNLQEYRLGTDPNNPDTDGDGLPDNWEYRYAYDEDKTELVVGVPRWMAEFDGADDTDGDGDTNIEEYLQGSRDPTIMDAREKEEKDNTLLVVIIALIVILIVAIILIALIMLLGRVRPVEKEFPEERFPHLYKND